ncbi:GDP-mannose 4,6-dehydratase [Crocinitomicaceae bacterium]|nr:GDP-mannose 4,6-dehydratase [Crocinitomicaceae bacterium]
MKKAIVFGITGQDGSHLADLLLSKGYHVVGVSRRASTDNTQRIKHILGNERFDLAQGDITDAHSVINVFKNHSNVDEIYNLAAQSHVAVSFKQPALTWDITGKGCLNILQSIVDLGIKGRFYQASSSEMFGRNYDVTADSVGTMEDGMEVSLEKYQDEDTKFMPQSPYAIAKCAAHYMTALYRDAYGMHASAGILFNHEGERRGENFVTRKITKWIGEFVKWCRDAEFGSTGIELPEHEDMVRVYGRPLNKPEFPKLRLGNLEAFRDWGYAGDYVEAMWMMLQQDSPQDFVICTGETHTIREFLDVAFGKVGIDDWSDLVVQDPEFYRAAEVEYLRGDCSKAKNVLGWTPKHGFEDLVKLMVDHDVLNNG